METWVDCLWNGGVYVGIYQVSDLGRVRSVDRVDNAGKRQRGRIIKPQLGTTGYFHVRLYCDGKGKTIKVHKLVAMHFTPNWFESAHINHMDLNRLNNNASNLEYTTQAKNNEHAFARKWLVTFPCNKQEVVYNLSKFCREYGLHTGSMCYVAQGEQSNHKGFRVELIGGGNG